MGRGGDKHLPFPTYYTNNPDHVLGARTSSRDRWLAAPKYKLLNLDDRDVAIKKYDKVSHHPSVTFFYFLSYKNFKIKIKVVFYQANGTSLYVS